MIEWATSHRELLESVGWIAFKLHFAVDVYLRCVAFITIDVNPIIQLRVLVVVSQDSSRLVFIYLAFARGESEQKHVITLQ